MEHIDKSPSVEATLQLLCIYVPLEILLINLDNIGNGADGSDILGADRLA